MPVSMFFPCSLLHGETYKVAYIISQSRHVACSEGVFTVEVGGTEGCTVRISLVSDRATALRNLLIPSTFVTQHKAVIST